MIPLVLCIDLEQDDIRSPQEALRSWRGAHGALAWWSSLRDDWGAAAHCNWFVRSDVQVATVLGDAGWPLRELREDLADALAAGDSVGMHPHLYRNGPDGWRNDFADTDFAWQCALVALQAYHDEFGRPCPTWRWGDRVGQRSLAAELAAHGLQFDATAEPGRVGLPPRDGGPGAQPSYVGHPTEPSYLVDGLVDWPVSTYDTLSLQRPTTGRLAVAPIGSFDSVTNQWLQGWCCDAAGAATPAEVAPAPIDVELLLQGTVVDTTSADWFRPDLHDAGYGGGRHGVRFAMRDEWRTLPVDAFLLRPMGHEQPLPGTPVDQRTERGGEASVNPLPVDIEVSQFERAVEVLLSAGRSHLTLATRSEVFIDPSRASAVEANMRTLRAHVLAGRLSTPRTLEEAAADAAIAPSASTA